MLLFNNIITICYGNFVGHQYTKLNTNNIDPESKHEGNIVADSTPLNDLKTRRHVHVFEQTLCTQHLQNRKCLCFLYIVYVYIYSNNQNVIATEYTE
jgi:hypothetical protein